MCKILIGGKIQASVLGIEALHYAFQHCILVILIDGTHLYDKYGGVLITVTTVDGFNHLIPLAFAVVESENAAS